VSIRIAKDGTVHGMNEEDVMDQVFKDEHVESKRVSDIWWNGETQEWEVRAIIDEVRENYTDCCLIQKRILSPVLFRHRQKKECVAWELSHEDEILKRVKGLN